MSVLLESLLITEVFLLSFPNDSLYKAIVNEKHDRPRWSYNRTSPDKIYFSSVSNTAVSACSNVCSQVQFSRCTVIMHSIIS